AKVSDASLGSQFHQGPILNLGEIADTNFVCCFLALPLPEQPTRINQGHWLPFSGPLVLYDVRHISTVEVPIVQVSDRVTVVVDTLESTEGDDFYDVT